MTRKTPAPFVVVSAALLVAAVTAGGARQEPASVAADVAAATDADTAWVCPMHPDHTSEGVGRCPRCGMLLVRATPFDVRDYGLDFRTVPAIVRHNQKTSLFFTVRHPDSNEAVKRFEMVHEKRYHLFVVSQDMQFFEHIHPEQADEGTWSAQTTLPRAGYYKVLSDFLPSGGSSQFLARPLVTANYAGDLAGDSARLVPDTVLTKTADDLTVSVTFDPPAFVAGQYGHITFHLTDTVTRRPVTDLQTYLGAFGHTLIMSEDMGEYVHSHPIEIVQQPDDGGPPVFLIPPGTDLEAIRGGPDVTFEGLMPKPGVYRSWTQFRRHDKVRTVALTFAVAAATE